MNNLVLNLLNKASPQLSSLNQIASVIKAARDPVAALNNLAQSDPRMQQVAEVIRNNNGDIQQAVRALAQQKGVDVNALLAQAKSLM